MIKSVNITNLGPLNSIKTEFTENINVIVGRNDSGKTLFLKNLYVALRALETFKKGKEPKSFKKILDEKLYWTFQLEKLGDLVRKGADNNRLKFEAIIDEQKLWYIFSSSAVKGVGDCSESLQSRAGSTVFIPAKEVLTIEKVIRKSRELDREFGFDDTFLDLINYLDKPTRKGGGKYVTEARKDLKNFLGGEILNDTKKGWYFKKGNSKFDIQITAEGVKKIAILDRLIGNKVINKDTVLIIDEPESHLHPGAILFFMDILKNLSKQGVQIFLSTHSYFVIKKLTLISQDEEWPVKLLSINEESGLAEMFNLQDGVPDIPIIDAAVQLYEAEIERALDI